MAKGMVFLKVGYTKDLGKAQAHVKYVCFRAKELEYQGREIFGPEKDRDDARAFIKRIDDPATKHSQSVKIHKILISMRQEDFEKYGADYKKIVREAMADMEREKGMKLDWIAATHMKEGHPHVHVIVKSVGKTPEGKNKRLMIRKDEYSRVRGEVYKVLREERGYQRAIDREILHELRREQRARVMPVRLSLELGQSIAFEIEKIIREEEYQRELEQRSRRR